MKLLQSGSADKPADHFGHHIIPQALTTGLTVAAHHFDGYWRVSGPALHSTLQDWLCTCCLALHSGAAGSALGAQLCFQALHSGAQLCSQALLALRSGAAGSALSREAAQGLSVLSSITALHSCSCLLLLPRQYIASGDLSFSACSYFVHTWFRCLVASSDLVCAE